MCVERTDFLQVTAGCRKNSCPDKPCEDAFWLGAEPRIFCVADGITRSRRADGSYPNPSPASKVATMVVSAVASLFGSGNINGDTEYRVLEALRIANCNIQEYVREQSKNEQSIEVEIPGAVATVLAFEGSCAMFAHLGDCTIVHFRRSDLSNPQRLTVDQTAAVRKWLFETNSMAWEAKLDFIRKSIRNRRNHPLAFGVLSGDVQGLRFVQTGTTPVGPGDLFLLCTDGLESVLANLATDLDLQSLIARRDVEALLDYAEHLDQRLQRRSDDKTLLLIDLLP
jgi:serine/threonine protein phosphatase PrpC